MKKIAAIDIGTNSMRLLLCEYGDKGFGEKSKDLIVTRMGQNIAQKNVLAEAAIQRNLDALKIFKNKAAEYGAENIIAIATSAVRDAENKADFLEAAYKQTGIGIRVISGEEEADLGITGVLSDCLDIEGDILVIDIGGGSTEFVLGNSKGIQYSTSIKAGTVRMTEKFVSAHPIKSAEIDALNEDLKHLFEAPSQNLASRNIQKVIGIGGTATTIAAIYHKLSIYDASKVHNTHVTYDYIYEIFQILKNMTVEQRYRVAGLQKERADVIPVGMAIMLQIMQQLGLPDFYASENDNLEGAIIKYTKGE